MATEPESSADQVPPSERTDARESLAVLREIRDLLKGLQPQGPVTKDGTVGTDGRWRPNY